MDDDKLKQLEAISKSYALAQPQARITALLAWAVKEIKRLRKEAKETK